jgi:quaternary ammonium compound-resistance protein SugE
VGAFVLGLLLFAEPATLARFFFVGLIVAGIVGLKLVSAH